MLGDSSRRVLYHGGDAALHRAEPDQEGITDLTGIAVGLVLMYRR
jgi:hypothetical protein